ncbi:MAG: diaminopimelate decarboxylase, partial [Eubacterium sp.]|nr:diaminopimelate decarboxylase [Eubacterium sp.]
LVGSEMCIIDRDLFEIIKDNADDDNITIVGIQYFSSTQRTSLKKFKREFEYLSDLISRLRTDYGFDVKELEYGTGFPVFYFQSDSFEEDEYFKEFSNLFNELLPKDVKVTFEIGRSIAASCGYYFTTVVDKKINKVGNFAILDGGINHLVYFGQTMAMKFPYIDLYPARECSDTEDWNLCGSLCTVNDIIVKALPLADLNINDVLVFKNTGAYCMCEGISLFLTRELPGVVIVDDDEQYTLVRDNYKTSNLNRPNY